MDKREYIIEMYEKLLHEESDNDISIGRLTKEANIAKGGVYYYFNSKEELLDAVLEKNYLSRIKKSLEGIDNNLKTKDKLIQLFKNYMKDDSTNYLDKALHAKSNAYLHQKSLVFIAEEFSKVISMIICGSDDCIETNTGSIYENALILMGTLVFILDENLFPEINNRKYKIVELAFSNFSQNIGLESNIFFEVIKNE